MRKLLLLLALAILPPLLVVLSCTTTQGNLASDRVAVNTGPDRDGRVYTTQVIDLVESVIALDLVDRSLRLELSASDWSYNPQTTELTVHRSVPFKNLAYHLEGQSQKPVRLILGQDWDSTEAPLVLVADRIGVEGFDYSWDGATRGLTFRRDLDLEALTFQVSYRTLSGGSNTYGNHIAGPNTDYLVAQREWAALKKRIETQAEFPFLEKTMAGPPRVVLRPATAEEKRQMLGDSPEIVRPQAGKTDQAITTEVGFDARIPDRVVFSDKSFGASGVRMVVESTVDGGLRRRVLTYFSFSDRPQGAEDPGVLLTLFDGPPPPLDQEFLIETTNLAGGMTRTTAWALEGPQNTVRPVSTYRGESRGVSFEITCAADEDTRKRVEQLIQGILNHRK